MSLTNPNKVITEERLSEFYGQILPYLGGMPEAVANKFNKSDLYSTDEKIVGCWTDGKPIYQKVLTSTTASSSDYKYISIGTGVSVDKFIKLNAMVYDGAGNVPFSGISCTESSFGNSLTGIRVTGLNNLDGGNPNVVAIKTNAAVWQNKPVMVIAQYTKTTDAVNSFKYGSETDYSTDEKIVGTWVDGKHIYQKSISFGNLVLHARSQETFAKPDAVVANVSRLVKWSISHSGGAHEHYILQDASNPAATVVVSWLFLSDTANSRWLLTGSRGAGSDLAALQDFYVTVQYTKTTD